MSEVSNVVNKLLLEVVVQENRWTHMALPIDAQLAALRRMAASCQARYNGESNGKEMKRKLTMARKLAFIGAHGPLTGLYGVIYVRIYIYRFIFYLSIYLSIYRACSIKGKRKT